MLAAPVTAFAEDAALEECVERFGRDEHEFRLAADQLPDRGQSALARIGDGHHRAPALDAERDRAHLPRVLGGEQRVRLRVDREHMALTKLELILLGERLRRRDRFGGLRRIGGDRDGCR